MKFSSILFFTFITLTLSACSLADDITPPPGYQSPVPQPTMGPLLPANPPDLAAGAAIFAEKCAPCHGAHGLGDGPQAANLPKQPSALGKPEIARAAVPADWYAIVTQGKIASYMPPFNSLDNQQRWDVVAYALSLGAVPEKGKSVYDAKCATCHGMDGKKSAKSDFSDQARMAKLSLNDLFKPINMGVESSMPAFESQLSETERYAAAAYLRSFTFAPAHEETASAAESPTGTMTSTALATQASAAVPTTSGAPDEIVGTISGKITNKSGGSVPADLKVVLHIFLHDAASSQFSEIDTQETSINAAGIYSFAGLPMPTSQAFYVSVDYADTTYDSEPVVPTAGQTTYDLPLDIYETTTDSSGLLADQVHIILDYSKPDIIQVVEFYVISNPGTKTVIPKKGATLVTVTLPKGYTNLQFQDGQLGDRFIQTAGGFGDTLPASPGSQKYQLVFAFDLPYSTNFDFIEPLSLDVSAITFLVSEGVKANAPGIIDGGLKDMGNGGGKYQLYTVGAYKTGQSLKINVSGAPNQTVSAANSGPVTGTDSTRNVLIGVGAFGLALIVAGGWLFWRDRKRAPDKEILPEPEPDINSDEIINAIIALDDQHNAGNIADEPYQQRRAELKEKLKEKI
jgi:mono/diheme cytochrome c family protein